MKLETIEERIQNAEATIEKKKGTVDKKQKLIEKKTTIQAAATDENEVRWIGFDIEHLKEDIERLNKQIAELEQKLETYRTDRERIAAEPSLPEHLQLMLPEIVGMLDDSGEAYAAHLREAYNKAGYREFIRTHSHVDYEWMNMGKERRHKENEKDAEILLKDLYRRVHEVTGEIMDWGGLRLEIGTHGFTVLNGRVEGEKGTALVESITAGGYNIQRLHIRVLVKPLR